MITIENILWVKNVKRDDGTGIAYFEKEQELEFNLNFSESQVKGNDAIKINDVILLFQRIDKISEIKDRTYLTHLVTPLDCEVSYDPNNPKFPYERRVAVIAKANPALINPVFSKPDRLSFFKPNWGKVCSVQLLNSDWPIDAIKNEIWDLFSSHFNKYYQENILRLLSESTNITIDIDSALEGKERELFKRHLIRERNPQLIKRVKGNALLKGNGSIECECCKFSFNEFYGDFTNGFIECHHRNPISLGGERITTEVDLALVCSNCHRMLHKKNYEGKYYTVEELKEIIYSRLN